MGWDRLHGLMRPTHVFGIDLAQIQLCSSSRNLKIPPNTTLVHVLLFHCLPVIPALTGL